MGRRGRKQRRAQFLIHSLRRKLSSDVIRNVRGSGRNGFKSFLNEFLQRKLSVTLSLAILGVALVAGIFSFFLRLQRSLDELQDDVLRQVAALMDRQHLAPDVLAVGVRIVTRATPSSKTGKPASRR